VSIDDTTEVPRDLYERLLRAGQQAFDGRHREERACDGAIVLRRSDLQEQHGSTILGRIPLSAAVTASGSERLRQGHDSQNASCGPGHRLMLLQHSRDEDAFTEEYCGASTPQGASKEVKPAGGLLSIGDSDSTTTSCTGSTRASTRSNTVASTMASAK
jgi:hypothetical protein